MVLIAIPIREDESPRYDVHFRAPGNEGVDSVLCEKAFDDRRQLVDVASLFDLVDQLVMNQILVTFIGKNDMLLCGGPELVIFKQTSLSRTFRAKKQALFRRLDNLFENHV